ncbi:SixA phosphatase family protein [Sulfurimonas sp.]|uniref:SixA phosphatase family protein n=1 Tax=Sulfurimonas sp. TaxID=2022749 RepID=UPI003D0A7F80
MKTVILIRHAKSSWKDIDVDDFDRPLNKRGKREAPIMAEHLKSHNIAIEKIFSSPAKRAKKTAKIFSEILDVEVEYYDELYDPFEEEILELINEQLGEHDVIAIVSHNPELTDLCNMLSDQEIDNIPTSAYVILESEEEEIDENSCKVVDFAYPKREDIAVKIDQ